MRTSKVQLAARSLLVAAVIALHAHAQPSAPPAAPEPTPAASPASNQPPEPKDLPVVTKAMIDQAFAKAVPALVALQGKDGDDKDQWAYEGVYRVRGQIPVGYRIGGTAIVLQALLAAPGYSDDKARQDAVHRGLAYICAARSHPLMSTDDYAAGYDVRAWGSIEATWCLAVFKHQNKVPADLAKECDAALSWYVSAMQKLEMPKTGGWNYARPAGADTVGPPSPFMTSRALQALFEAARVGEKVDSAVVERGLGALARCRAPSGTVVYAGAAPESPRKSDSTPGAIGRICSSEATLALAGRGDEARTKAAAEAFVTNWKWLAARRAKNGTHEGPYAVAPYYFMFAHLHAAQTAELLPEADRQAARDKMNALLFSVRAEDGTWNDRVFNRSSAYGTAMAVLAMLQPELMKGAAKWTPPAEAQQK